jgi:hypothetical protein
MAFYIWAVKLLSEPGSPALSQILLGHGGRRFILPSMAAEAERTSLDAELELEAAIKKLGSRRTAVRGCFREIRKREQ